MKNKNIVKFMSIFIILVVFGLLNYFWLIPLNLRYTEVFVLFIMLFLVVYIITFGVLNTKELVVGNKFNFKKGIVNKTFFVVLPICFILIILHSVSSHPIIFSKDYQKLIGKVTEKDFIKDFDIIKNNQIPVVDESYAEKLGDKKLGSDRGLGSEYHVGKFSDIIVDGRMVMVAPLEFNGFFKWLNNKSTPGYVVVDKITSEVKLVTKLKEKDIKMKYVSSAYFNDNLKRVAYFNGNMDNKMIKSTFELDDEGNPYFIINKVHKTIGINGGEDVYKVVLVNAITGDVKTYDPKDTPKWVDTIYPKKLVINQLDSWGLYVNGFWNTLFSEKNVVKTTEDSRRVFNKNTLYHYTGLTSSHSDESTIGFAFVNTRTKKTTLYKMVGATERAAMDSAEGKVKNYGYHASFPLPINIENESTFFIILKDASGLIKQYALVNIEDFSIVGNGETITKAVDSYIKNLNKEFIPDKKNLETITSKVVRIGSDVNEGITSYYVILENNKLYYCLSNVSREINITNPGDIITIKASKNKIIEFDNLNIK